MHEWTNEDISLSRHIQHKQMNKNILEKGADNDSLTPAVHHFPPLREAVRRFRAGESVQTNTIKLQRGTNLSVW